MTKIENWESLEFWVDTIPSPPKVLMLVGYSDRPHCDILDIAANHKVVCSHANYQEAVNWFFEDEFERVKGQILADEQEPKSGELETVYTVDTLGNPVAHSKFKPELEPCDFVTIAGLEIEA